MYLCTEQFLAEFEQSPRPLDYVVPVTGDRVRVMQLSDLHFRLEKDVEESSELQRHIRRLSGFITNTKEPLSPEFHGLIVSGDLIYAPGCKEDTEQCTRRHHRFSKDFICKAAQESLGIANIQKQCLVLPGNHDVLRDSEKANTHGHPERAQSFLENVHNVFDTSTYGSISIQELAESPRLVLLGNTNGILAIIGLDSNQAAYNLDAPRHGLVQEEQLERLKETAYVLAEKFPSIPVYLMVSLHHHLLPVKKYDAIANEWGGQNHIEGVTLDSADLLEALSLIKASLVTYGHMHTYSTPVASYSDLTTAQEQPPIRFIACPVFDYTHKRGRTRREPYRGCLILNSDLYRGTFRIDILTEPDKGFLSRSGHIRSITRIPTIESRVHRRLTRWLGSGKPEDIDGLSFTAVSQNQQQKGRFREAANAFWKEFGYTLLGAIPPLGDETENGQSPSDLLTNSRVGSFLKEGVEFPSPEPDSSVREKSYRLLVLLKNDGLDDLILLNNQIPVRQSFYGNWDAPLFPAFKSVGLLLENIRNDLERIEHSLQDLDEPAGDQEKRRKAAREALGILGEENKEEQIRDRLIDLETRDFLKLSPVDGQPQRYRMTLTVVPHFSLKPNPSNPDSLARAVDTLPRANENEDFRSPSLQRESRTIVARDGYVWFPLDKWRNCPALLARNADVMAWAYDVISNYKKKYRKSAILDAIYCGKLDDIEDVWPEISREHTTSVPFSGSTKDLHGGFPSSLEEGLRRVRLNPDRELKEIRPYENAVIEPVIIRKVEGNTATPRIAVFETGKGGKKLGYLRPVQRYVLRYGIGRAARFLKEKIPADQLGSEETGYLVIHTPGEYVALLPPILELLSEDRPECPSSEYEEFIVCDGNHRVIAYCWDQEKDVRCVLIRPGSEPLQPYYAYPGSSYDWKNTAASLRTSSPDLYGKYSPRQPDSKERSSDEYTKYGEYWYRRFFRDFNTGFKNVGSQGGNI
uniref:Calcineurin-like phosphoesterase n=1 Tax=Candidatus Kentrum sp. FM TaxID=2126340 RepID=A0A450SBF2_9GAMM|nr:MAG: Calcineurin-like phosphoesterase [Candidatus Kentron sp. FM]VFJ49847.1 MAG: Calcineurin-like phosphoesterase [Candidatus Kentron sp. FM]VFK11001.1 MAG: Calcineurin-like phosphoesterase [Candidatus Kentron sp. FM]